MWLVLLDTSTEQNTTNWMISTTLYMAQLDNIDGGIMHKTEINS